MTPPDDDLSAARGILFAIVLSVSALAVVLQVLA